MSVVYNWLFDPIWREKSFIVQVNLLILELAHFRKKSQPNRLNLL